MSEATQAERDDLEGLLQHPGWARYQQMVQREWGPSGERYQQAVELAASKADPDLTRDSLKVIILTHKEIKRLLALPVERVQHLTHATAPVLSVSRRGGL